MPVPKKPVLVSAEEIRSIAERALVLLEWSEDEPADSFEHEDQVDRTRAWDLSMEAFRFCAKAAGALADPALLPLVMDLVERRCPYDDNADDHGTAVNAGLTALLRAGAPVGERVRELTRHEDERIRVAVASGLLPSGEGLVLLRQLCRDPVPSVRRAARSQIGSAQAPPWWEGLFKTDPSPRLAVEERPIAEPALRELTRLLDGREWELYQHWPDVAAQVGKLPDHLASEAAEQLLGGLDRYDVNRHGALLTELLTREGAAERLIAVIKTSARHRFVLGLDEAVTQQIHKLDRPKQLAISLALAEVAVKASRQERVQFGDWPRVAACIASRTYPLDADPTPFLEWMLRLAADEQAGPSALDYVLCELGSLFGREGVRTDAIVDRVLEARVAGNPDLWKHVGTDRILTHAPVEKLRAGAQRAMSSADERVVQWAVDLLTGRAHDPERDGPKLDVVSRLFAEPRFRKHFANGLERRAVVPYRILLRSGKASLAEALDAMEAIHYLYGGMATRGRIFEVESKAPDSERQAELADVLGPPSLRGPVTVEEWEALRKLRDAELTEPESFRAACRCLPKGPRCDADRQFIDRVIAYAKRDAGAVILELASAIAATPTAGDLERLDQLTLMVDDPYLRGTLKRSRKIVAEDLGLDQTAPAEKGGAPADEPPRRQWMDEDDELSE